MIIKELKTKEEMLGIFPVLQELYPSLTCEQYEKELDLMLPNNAYGQVAAFDGETCAGVTGFWIGNKLWCGKYLEIDNFVVAKAFRSQGIGKAIIDYLKQKAVEENCSMVALDSYTTNFKAHKFFYNEGFGPKGFHFIHVLRDDALR
jgi:GNAT superfamily N-acetyltransferase